MTVAAGAWPLDAWPLDAFERRLEPTAAAPIAVAVSGGGDSLAALLATRAWAERVGRQVVVLTVDHGLQAQSGDWTRFVATVADRLGADFEALAWTGEKPATGLAAAARAARHRLIATAARRHGARVVVLGQTADDVAEAALMRAEGSSVGAPREWAPSPVWPEGRGVFLLRPLLGLRRAEIRERLVALGETWIDDPANDNPASLRARARVSLGLLPLRGRERRSPSANASGAYSAPALSTPQGEKASLNCPAGVMILDRAALRETAEPVRILGAALTSVGGGDRPPRRDRLAALAARLAGPGEVAATLVGAKLIADAGRILIVRNAGEAARGGLAPLALAPGETGVWDGRFEITAGEAAVTIEALAGHANALTAKARAALRDVPAAARGALPSYLDPVAGRTCPILAGAGSPWVRSLVAARFAAACGVISKEPAT